MNIIHKSKTHNQLLDAFKFLAAFAVMHLHTTLGNVGEEWSTVIRLACRWAVPFFFISAGYYLGQKHQTSKISLSTITANLVNLIGIFIVANITYLILSLGSGYIWFTNDVKYLFVGTFWHLWFLGSMIFAYLLIWFIDEVLGRATLYACGIMTLLSCIIVAIATTHLPVKINYDELPRFTSGFAFMVLGMILSKVNIFRINKSFSLSFVLLSIACIFAEVYGYHLGNALNSDLEMSVGIAMLAVSLFIVSQAFSIRENIFSTIGKRYALFIYLYHVFVFKMMIKCFAILKVNPAPLYIFFPIFALTILLGTVYLLETKFGRVFALLNGKLQVKKIINNNPRSYYTHMNITKKQRTYIPQNLEIKWETLFPILEELQHRVISSATELETWLKDKSELEAALEEDFAWRYIKMSCDTANEQLVKDFQYFATEIEPKISPIANELNKKLVESPYVDELDQQKYFVYLRAVRKALELFREENIPLFTDLQVKQQQYQGITGAMSVTLNGQEYTLEQASNFLKDTDRTIRQNAWETIQQRRLIDKDDLNILFDELVKLRHQVALNAGFENYRDYMFQALGRFDYTAKDCYKFAAAIEQEIVPILKEQAEKRKEALNLAELKPWDLEVSTTGKPALKPFQNGEELIDKSIACFDKIDPSLGEKLAIMKANNLFDVESRMGKAPGGYNYPLAETGAPFIFMNSANSLRDLTTMVHEGGHAIHTFLTANLELNDFKHCPSEVAELASMSMELISMDQWEVYFDKEEDLIRAKKEQLVDVLKTLPWVAVIDQFQHWIYTNPEHNAADRETAFKQIYSRFGAGFVDWTGFEAQFGNVWQKQLHLFEVPFYYIEYAIAQLGAIAVWKNYKENPQQGLQQYMDALALGYTKPMNEIYETAGIKFDFSADYIKELASFVKEELEKLG